jgi:hypothetical protein
MACQRDDQQNQFSRETTNTVKNLLITFQKFLSIWTSLPHWYQFYFFEIYFEGIKQMLIKFLQKFIVKKEKTQNFHQPFLRMPPVESLSSLSNYQRLKFLFLIVASSILTIRSLICQWILRQLKIILNYFQSGNYFDHLMEIFFLINFQILDASLQLYLHSILVWFSYKGYQLN